MLTRPPEDNELEGSLTQRDLTLLRLLTAGYSNLQITSEVSMAESKVKNSLSTLFQTIGVRYRTSAVLSPFAENLVIRRLSRA